jgi:hypothetical protein
MRASGGQPQDLADRQDRRLLIYRLVTISAADSGGARRNRAQRRRGDAIARESARKKTQASEGVRPIGLTEPPGRVRPGRLAPTGGPGPTGGPSLAEREKERVLTRF